MQGNVRIEGALEKLKDILDRPPPAICRILTRYPDERLVMIPEWVRENIGELRPADALTLVKFIERRRMRILRDAIDEYEERMETHHTTARKALVVASLHDAFLELQDRFEVVD